MLRSEGPGRDRERPRGQPEQGREWRRGPQVGEARLRVRPRRGCRRTGATEWRKRETGATEWRKQEPVACIRVMGSGEDAGAENEALPVNARHTRR